MLLTTDYTCKHSNAIEYKR